MCTKSQAEPATCSSTVEDPLKFAEILVAVALRKMPSERAGSPPQDSESGCCQ